MGKKRYSEQFKREAVRLVVEEGYTQKAAGDAVGVNPATIRYWLAQHEDQQPQERVYASEQDELESLRKQVVQLRMERDILKKAAAYFAQEDQS